MDPGSVFVKTERGRQEVAARTGALGAVQRRLLILIDGHRTVNDLGAYARVGELDSALGHLLAHGYVVGQGQPVALSPPAAPGFAASYPAEPARAATSRVEFERVRMQAAQFIQQRLGDAARPICAAVERCASPHELRQVLRGVELFVGQRLDTQTAQAFARQFGAMLL